MSVDARPDDAEVARADAARAAELQRFEALSHVAAGIAHELNTPAQFIADNASFVRAAVDDLRTFACLTRDAVSDATLDDGTLRARIAVAARRSTGLLCGGVPQASRPSSMDSPHHQRRRESSVRARESPTPRPRVMARKNHAAIALCRRDLTTFPPGARHWPGCPRSSAPGH